MAAGPPKCGCGLYAIGECVDCDKPLCADHGTVDGKFRCAKHHREMEAARAAAAEAKEQQKQAAREAKERAARDEQMRKETERRNKLAAEAADRARAERQAAAERAEWERQRRLERKAEEDERARQRVEASIASYPCDRPLAVRLLRAGISSDAAHRWVAAGVAADEILDWIADGCEDPALVPRFDRSAPPSREPRYGSMRCGTCGAAISLEGKCGCT